MYKGIVRENLFCNELYTNWKKQKFCKENSNTYSIHIPKIIFVTNHTLTGKSRNSVKKIPIDIPKIMFSNYINGVENEKNNLENTQLISEKYPSSNYVKRVRSTS